MQATSRTPVAVIRNLSISDQSRSAVAAASRVLGLQMIVFEESDIRGATLQRRLESRERHKFRPPGVHPPQFERASESFRKFRTVRGGTCAPKLRAQCQRLQVGAELLVVERRYHAKELDVIGEPCNEVARPRLE